MTKSMNATLKQALAEKQNKRPVKTKIIQVRMDTEMHQAAGALLKKRGLKFGDFFRSAAGQLIRDAR
jgi:hypothetical protein